jgi:putative oxidoreductase
MRGLIARTTALFERIPLDVIAALARLGVGAVFLRSGLLKLEGWSDGATLALFVDEYKLPLIPPEAAAWLAMGAELTLPVLLFLGLFTRFAALALLFMTLVIEVFVYPNAFDAHGVWAVSLLFLMKYGAGAVSLDAVVAFMCRRDQINVINT